RVTPRRGRGIIGGDPSRSERDRGGGCLCSAERGGTRKRWRAACGPPSPGQARPDPAKTVPLGAGRDCQAEGVSRHWRERCGRPLVDGRPLAEPEGRIVSGKQMTGKE